MPDNAIGWVLCCRCWFAFDGQHSFGGGAVVRQDRGEIGVKMEPPISIETVRLPDWQSVHPCRTSGRGMRACCSACPTPLVCSPASLAQVTPEKQMVASDPVTFCCWIVILALLLCVVLML